jgi:hypothetical protein
MMRPETWFLETSAAIFYLGITSVQPVADL